MSAFAAHECSDDDESQYRWDSDEYGESVMSEATMRFLNGGGELDY